MIRSPLVYRETAPGAEPATLVAFHGEGGDAGSLEALAVASGVARALLPQAPRPVNPMMSGRDSGYSWFRQDERGVAEPASFGDALAQAARFAEEAAGRAGAPLLLVGEDRGGALALATAAVTPVAGVVGLRAWLPEIPGWSLPRAGALRGAPVLLLYDTHDAETPPERVKRTLDALADAGAEVRIRPLVGLAGDARLAAPFLREWTAGVLARAARLAAEARP